MVPFRRAWIGLLLFSLSMINYTDRVALSVAAPLVAKDFHLSPVGMGYLLSSFVWTYALFLIPMGLLLDRGGTKATAAFGILVWSAAMALSGAAWSFASLLTARLAMGGGESSSNPVGGKVIREWIPASERGTFNAIFNSGSYAGPAFASALIGFLIAMFGWRMSFVLASAAGFVWLGAWLRWFDVPERVPWLGEDERRLILQEREAKGTSAEEGASANGLRSLLSRRTMWGLALTQGCNVYSQYLLLTWLPSYLQSTKHLTTVKTGLFSSIPYGCAVILCIFWGQLSDSYLRRRRTEGGKRRNMVAAALLLASSILIVPIVYRIWTLILVLTIALTGIAATTSLNFALLSDLLPNARDMGKGMALLVAGGNIFGLMAPILTGYVIAATGSYNWAFAVAGLLLVLGAIIVLTMTTEPIFSQTVPAATRGTVA